jgi:hypothetical protein
MAMTKKKTASRKAPKPKDKRTSIVYTVLWGGEPTVLTAHGRSSVLTTLSKGGKYPNSQGFRTPAQANAAIERTKKLDADDNGEFQIIEIVG